jgi:hypothetical protein
MKYSPYVRVPEAEKQTPMRRIKSFWIAGMGILDPAPPLKMYALAESPLPRPETARFGAWLMRSAANPHWHGFESDMPIGKSRLDLTSEAAHKVAGLPPEEIVAIDLIGTLQPGEERGIRRTTFISTFIARALPKPSLPTVEMGLFPIDNLPTDQMGPDGHWIPELLEGAVAAGMSTDCTVSDRYHYELSLQELTK